jgi:membrane-associated phospholipid phosphatase
MRFSRSVFCAVAIPTILFFASLFPFPTLSQSASPPASSTSSTSGDRDRAGSLKQLPSNLLDDQKSIWLFPVSLAHGQHILPAIGIVGVTSAFIVTDAHSAPPFRTTSTFHGFNNAFSGSNTGAIIAAVPAAIYAVGYFRKDSYAENSALLAAEAFADGFLLDLPMKAIAARRQPISYSGNGPYTDSFFNGTHNPLHSGGFYSGHAIAAMAVATVLAHRYRQHHWVPFLAYGLAGAICFSRITTSNHFPGDIVVGGAMGFVIARYAVLPPR